MKNDSPRRVSSRSEKFKRNICFSAVACCMAAVLFIEISGMEFADDEVLSGMISSSVSRLIGAAALIIVSAYFGYKLFDPFREPFFRSLIFVLPCLAVAINNFPIVGLITGDVRVIQPASYVAALALQCFFIGLFEEFAFRGVMLLVILEKRRKTILDVFVSICLTSAVFGVIHLLNLFAGAGLGSVVLQIGYSFLIGGMCSVILLKTHSIWYCVLVHSVFDFGGLFVSMLGTGEQWDGLTVSITVILALAVAAYVAVAFIRLDPRSIDDLYSENISTEMEKE